MTGHVQIEELSISSQDFLRYNMRSETGQDTAISLRIASVKRKTGFFLSFKLKKDKQLGHFSVMRAQVWYMVASYLLCSGVEAETCRVNDRAGVNPGRDPAHQPSQSHSTGRVLSNW